MATNVEKLILAIETQKFDQAEKELKRIRKAAEGAGKAIEDTGKKAKGSGVAFKGLRGSTSALSNTQGQLSVQLQDVAVQLQSNTDQIRILAQQGPQIASIFGPTGAVIGALIAFGALLATGARAAQEQRVELEKTADILKGLRSSFADLTKEQRNLVEAGTNAEISKLNIELTKQNNIISSTKAILASPINYGKEEIVKFEKDLSEAQIQAAGLTIRISELQAALDPLGTAQKAFVRQLREQVIAQSLSNIEQLKAKVNALELKGVLLDEANALIMLLEQKENEKKANKQAKEDREDRIRWGKYFQKLVDDESKATAKASKEKTDALIAEGKEFRKLVDEEGKLIDQQGKDRENLRIAQAKLAIQEDLALRRESEQLKSELYRAGILEREEFENMSYERQIEALKLANAKKLLSDEEYKKAKANLDKKVQDYTIKTAADGLKALGQYNRDAFEASKAVESGRAIMQTYSGATKALADLPFPYNIAAAAGIVAFGLAQVAQIQSQSYSGRAVGGQVRAGESYIVGERGPEVLTMGKTGSIIPNDRLRGSQGQVVNKTANVTFQITTNDTAGFDDLLRSRRGQIIGIINEALNDQGKAALA